MPKHDEEEWHTRKELKTARKLSSKKDRSKYKKTNVDQRERAQRELKDKKLLKKELVKGRVLEIKPEGITVDAEGILYCCNLRGALKLETTHLKNLVTVGDCVLFEIGEEGQGAIAHIEPRYSILSRQDHLRRRHKQLIAANIDQVFITISVVKPPLKPALVDRYLIAAFKGGMQPIIVINKIDLLQKDTEEYELYVLFLETYHHLHIPTIAVSTYTGEGLEQLKQLMHGKASVFSGQSGVGKSSLINIMTGLNLPISGLVEKTSKGRHTTSTASLIPLAFGGWCIDTPGIRSFGIWDLNKEDLVTYFSEIAAIGRHCHFPNCTHTHEPECAVIEALNGLEISPLRYDSYLKLLQEIS